MWLVTPCTLRKTVVNQTKFQDFHWIGPLGRFSHRVPMSVCVSVCLSVCLSVTIQNTLFRRSWRPLVEGRIANIGTQWQKKNYSYFSFNDFFCVFQLLRVFEASLLWASLLWIMGELARGGSPLPHPPAFSVSSMRDLKKKTKLVFVLELGLTKLLFSYNLSHCSMWFRLSFRLPINRKALRFPTFQYCLTILDNTKTKIPVHTKL